MAAMAMRTERVRLGAIVTPPPRRRPWKLARETMTLDRLSNGRLVFPVGLGALDDGAFGNVGEPTDNRVRAELLDESLEIIEGLWTGEPFGYEGRHYRFAPMTFRPTPVQRPRIPIWVVGAWPHERSMRRVLRYDGIVTQVERPGRDPGDRRVRRPRARPGSGRPAVRDRRPGPDAARRGARHGRGPAVRRCRRDLVDRRRLGGRDRRVAASAHRGGAADGPLTATVTAREGTGGRLARRVPAGRSAPTGWSTPTRARPRPHLRTRRTPR